LFSSNDLDELRVGALVDSRQCFSSDLSSDLRFRYFILVVVIMKDEERIRKKRK
jgi:hypothetical protein